MLLFLKKVRKCVLDIDCLPTLLKYIFWHPTLLTTRMTRWISSTRIENSLMALRIYAWQATGLLCSIHHILSSKLVWHTFAMMLMMKIVESDNREGISVLMVYATIPYQWHLARRRYLLIAHQLWKCPEKITKTIFTSKFLNKSHLLTQSTTD